MYEQENVRNDEPPDHSRLKTIVRRHVGQTMRTRNFRARNERVERGAVTKSRQGRKVIVERKVENAISGKQFDHVRMEKHAVSVMLVHLGTEAIRDKKKDNRLLLRQKRRHRLTERNHQKVEASEEKDCVPKFPEEQVYESVV